MGFGQQYQQKGIKGFYQNIGEQYLNPHDQDIRNLILKIANPNLSYLDLACGTGIVSLTLKENGVTDIFGIDPFLFDQYTQKTGLPCTNETFEEIANKGLSGSFDVVIISYALHLLPESFLPQFLYQLSLKTKQLVILTPHKRPKISHYFNEIEVFKQNKTTMKIYKNIGF